MKRVLIIHILLATVLCAQPGTTPDSSGKLIYIRNAESLVGTTIDSQLVRELIGNVHLEQGDVTVYCDHAIQYTAQNRVTLKGKVRVINGTLTLLMPRGEWFGNTEVARGDSGVKIIDRKTTLVASAGTYSVPNNEAIFHGGVQVEDDSIHIDADSAIYLRSTQESFAFGDVVLRSKYSNTVVYGDSAHNVPRTSYSVVRGSPLLVYVDTVASTTDTSRLIQKEVVRDSVVKTRSVKTPKKKVSKLPTTPTKPAGKIDKKSTKKAEAARPQADSLARVYSDSTRYRLDTLGLWGDVLESFRAGGESRFAATGSCELVRKNLAATAGRIVYDNSDESIELLRKPRVWFDSLQLSADSIWISVPQKKISEIRAHHSAFMALRDSGLADRPNQLEGRSVFIRISSDTLRNITTRGDAKSLYFLKGDEGPDGASRTICDSILVNMDKGEIENIVWRSGVSSEYYPENMVASGSKVYYLPLYSWVESRPILSRVRNRFRRQPSEPNESDAVQGSNTAIPAKDK